MKIRELLIALSIVTAACSGCASTVKTVEEPKTKVDTSSILHLQGRIAGGSACPVSPTVALTSGHVVLLEGGNDTSLQSYSYSNDRRFEGYLDPPEGSIFRFADLAILSPFPKGEKFESYYEISSEAPFVGDSVVFIGYDWKNPQRALRTRVFQTEIINIVARTIIMKDHGEPGSSGSCVLLAKNGKVVGINRGYVPLEDGSIVGTAVGVWPLKAIVEEIK